MAGTDAGGAVTPKRDAAAALTVAAGLSYACGYLVQRARAYALGTEPDFALLDEGYVFAGFRFALAALLALLVVLPVVLALRAAAGRLRRALNPRALAIADGVAMAGLGVAGFALLKVMAEAGDTLLSPPAAAGTVRHYARESVLGRSDFGLGVILAGTALAACAVLWLRARLGLPDRRSAPVVAIALLAVLLLVQLPIQHGFFHAGRKARLLERLPEGLGPAAVPPAWLVDRGKETAVLLLHDAMGRPRLVTVKAERLEGIGVIGIARLGSATGGGGP